MKTQNECAVNKRSLLSNYLRTAALTILATLFFASAAHAVPKLITYGDSITNWLDATGQPADNIATDGLEYMQWRDDLQDMLGIGAYDWVGRFNSGRSPYDTQTSAFAGSITNEQLAYLQGGDLNRLLDDTTGQMPAGSLALIDVGINDVLQHGFGYWNGMHPSLTYQPVTNIKSMISTLRNDTRTTTIAIYVGLLAPVSNQYANWISCNSWIDTFNGNLTTELTNLDDPNLHIVNVHDAFITNTTWQTSLMSTDGLHPTDDGDFVIAKAFHSSITSVTPEPVSSVLFLIGGGMLAALKSRKKARKNNV